MSESQRPRHPLEAPTSDERESEDLQQKLLQGRAVRLIWPQQVQKPWLTWGLLILLVLIFAPYFFNPSLYRSMLNQGAVQSTAVLQRDQWWRLVTHMFLHLDPSHIAMNGLTLYFLGSDLERVGGRRRYVIIYILAGLAGGLLQIFLGGTEAGVGASGALFGVAGAYIVFMWQHKQFFPTRVRQSVMQLVALLVLQLVIGFAPGSSIANWAHIGGLIMGLACGWLIGPRYIPVPEGAERGEDGLFNLRLFDSQPLSGGGWVRVLGLGIVLLVSALLLKLRA